MGEVEAGSGWGAGCRAKHFWTMEQKEEISVRGELWGNDARETRGRAQKRS